MDQEPRSLIKRHNEYVREQVAHDLEALEEKLNVKRQMSNKAHDVANTVADRANTVVGKAKGTLGMDNTTEVHGVGDFVKQNAVPLAAVGLGGALLARNATKLHTTSNGNGNGYHATPVGYGLYESTETDSPGMKDKVMDKASGLTDVASSKVGDAKSTLNDATMKVTDKASGVKDSLSDAGSSALGKAADLRHTAVDKVPSRQQVATTAKNNAPILGLGALIVGAVAGAFAPRTRMEEERLAPLQETVLEKAKDTVQENVDKAKDAVQTGVDTVKDELAPSEDTSEEETDDDTLVTTPNRITGAMPTGGLPRNTNGMPSGTSSL
jgi:hypothetical protein